MFKKLYKLARYELLRVFKISKVRSAYGILLSANYLDNTFKMCLHGTYGFFYSDRIRGKEQYFEYLDIGSNQGLYTILAAKNKFCLRCFAFEPAKSTRILLNSNLKINLVEEKCAVFPYAISKNEGKIKMFHVDGHSGASSISNLKLTDTQNFEVIEAVGAKFLNNILPKEGVPLVVKIDVEGHEESVIEALGRSNCFSRIVEIFYEVDERWINPETINGSLKGKGFTLQKVGQGTHYDILATRRL